VRRAGAWAADRNARFGHDLRRAQRGASPSFERCGLLRQRIEVRQFEGDAATRADRTRTTRLAHAGVGRRIFEEEIATALQRPSETQDREDATEHVSASAATARDIRA
jgi:hypothetical protein